jgi:hypothetical protein
LVFREPIKYTRRAENAPSGPIQRSIFEGGAS